jgi:hypothetical protein
MNPPPSELRPITEVFLIDYLGFPGREIEFLMDIDCLASRLTDALYVKGYAIKGGGIYYF